MPRPALALIVLFLAGPATAADDLAPIETYRADQRQHWSFQPVARPEPPAVRDARWVRNPIDRFIRAEQEAVEFRPAPEATKAALIRRVTFDLTGLPPTPAETAAFLLDNRPDAYERLVDRLLASPHYGERWAQHWLDLAHYADSNGFELDAERPDAWRYRDWVVDALNQDMPYDRFVTLQLAGDEVEPGDTSSLIATGFGRAGPREVVGGNIDPEVRRQSELTEVTGTVGSVFLGLTLACARCHDHKFDPIPTTDYYRLQAFFAGAQMVEKPIASKAEEDSFEAAKKAIDAKVAPLKARMAEVEAPYRKALKAEKEATLQPDEKALLAIPEKDRTPAQTLRANGIRNSLKVTWEDVAAAVAKNPKDHAERESIKRQVHAIESALPRPPAKALVLVDESKEAPDSFVLKRGDVKTKGKKVAPRPPGVILASQSRPSFGPIEPADKTPHRRAALAAWLTASDHPLTARVIVNRLWQHHFGRGIVATPSDFGVRGEPPTHPELLDWLASELVAQGWRLKPIHRLIVTSAAYRQGTQDDPRQATVDPDNLLLWKSSRRRLDAEQLRDAMLAVSGELNPKRGGPGVLVPIEKEVEDLIFTEAEVVDLWPETPDPREHARRSLYLFRKRNVRYPLFDAFDAPDTQTACPRRQVSTHALQSLVTLNSDFATGRAKALAGRLLREAKGDARVDLAYRLALAREATPGERRQALDFVANQARSLRMSGRTNLAKPTYVPPDVDVSEAAAWVDFALAMMNRNEFLYVP